MENLTEDQFIDECLRDLVNAHREGGSTAEQFLSMLHPFERRAIAARLRKLGLVKMGKRKRLFRSRVWA